MESTSTVAKKLVEIAEERALSATQWRRPLVKSVLGEFWYPVSFFILGFDYLIQFFVKSAIYMVTFGALAVLTAASLDFAIPLQRAIVIIAVGFGLLVVFFPLPSRYAHLGIGENELAFLSGKVFELVSNKGEIDLVAANIEIMRKTVDSRVRALSWGTAAAWALFVFVFGQSVTIALKFDTSGEFMAQLLNGSIITLFVALLVALASLIGIAGYRIASNRIFAGLAMACNNARSQFEISGSRFLACRREPRSAKTLRKWGREVRRS